MSNLTIKSSQQKITETLDQITKITLENKNHIYLIYQPDDSASTLAKMVADKEVVEFEYQHYQIAYTPCLIDLNVTDEGDKNILRQSIADFYAELDPKSILAAKPRQVYGWIISSLDIKALASDMGFIAVQPADDGDTLVRYFDSVILSALKSIFNDIQKRVLIRPINYWLYLDGDGELVVQKNPQTAYKQLSPHLGIDKFQWQLIQQIEYRNAALAYYRLLHTNLPRLTESVADQILFKAFKSAALYGYTGKEDLIEYGYRALATHPRFIEHPTIQSVIKQNRNRSLTKQLQSITAAQWDLISKECQTNFTGEKQ